MMGFWLSRSLSYELFLFSRWNLGHHGAFHTNFFFFHDGILAIRKPFRRALLFFTMEFWLSGSFCTTSFFFHDGWLSRGLFTNPFFFHDGILAITEPFTRTFSFFTMEFWLSGCLSHELFLFSRWNLGYHEAFSRIFLSHGGISAITKPFHEFFFHIVESRLSRSLFTNFSFTWWNPQNARFGGRIFSYISHRVFT
jgi:hypothetical protein